MVDQTSGDSVKVNGAIQLLEDNKSEGQNSNPLIENANYNIKEFIPTFRFGTYIELAESLALYYLSVVPEKREQIEPNLSQKINFILKAVPTINMDAKQKQKEPMKQKVNSGFEELDQLSDDSYTVFTDHVERDALLLSEDCQEAALALAYFVHLSKGKYADVILPKLYTLLQTLPICKWQQRAKVSPDFFAYHLVSLLREVTNQISSERPNFASALVDHCVSELMKIMSSSEQKFLYESKNSVRVLFGVFKSLAEGLPSMSQEQTKMLYNAIEKFIQITTPKPNQNLQLKAFKSQLLKSATVLVMKILTRIAMSKQLEQDTVSNFVKTALKSISIEYVKKAVEGTTVPSSVVKLFIYSVDLAVECSMNYPEFIKETYASLSAVLKKASSGQAAKNEEEKMLIEVVKGMERLSLANSTLVPNASREMIEFIENSYQRSENLRNETAASLCNILKEDFQKNSIHLISQEVYSITSNIYQDKVVERNNTRIRILSSIANQLNHTAVTDLVLHVVVDHFTKKKTEGNIDEVICNELASLAHFGDAAFKEVTDLIFSIYQNPFHSSDLSNGQLLAKAIRIISQNLRDPQQKVLLLLRTIRLFNKLAADKDHAKTMPGHIGVLLPIISQQIKTTGIDIETTDPVILSAFRQMWFYCILYDFVREGEDQKYFESCQKIAEYTPVLLSTNTHNFVDTEEELNALLQTSVLTVSQFHEQLASLIAIPAATVKRLTFAQTVYLLICFYLEALRSRTGKFNYALNYLEDQRIFEFQDMYLCLNAVIDRVFNHWILYVENLDAETKEAVAEEQCVCMFIKYCNRYKSVRMASMKFISEMSKKFVALFWSEKCVRIMLDLLNLLHEVFDYGKSTSLLSATLPETNQLLYMPANINEREEMLNDFNTLALNWITSATSYAPTLISSALQQYMFKFQNSFVGSLKHFGFALATRLSVLNTQLQTPVQDKRKGITILSEDRFYSPTQAVSTKSYHLGELNSLREFSNLTVVELEKKLVARLADIMKKVRQNSKIETFLAEFNHSMQLATAFIVSNLGDEKNVSSLLQWVVWTPIYLFGLETMKTAIFCWQWILGSKPKLDGGLLSEVASAFCWTVEQGFGLFSGSKDYEGPVELAVSSEDVEANVRKDTSPHRLLINFIADTYNAVGMKHLDLFLRIILKALEDPHRLSPSSKGFGTRCRLCLLGLVISKHAKDSANLLRERVFAAGLTWFCLTPSWYDPNSTAILEEDIKVMREIITSLKAERAESKKYGSMIGGGGISETGSVTSRKTTMTKASKARSDSSTSKIKGMGSSMVNGSVEEKIVYFSAENGKLMDLLILLLSHELERIIIWKLPQNFAPTIQQYVNENVLPKSQPTIRQWKEYIDIAWNFNPRLAIKIAVRFPNDIVRDELRRLVRIHAAKVIDIPEAVTYLVTRENVERNAHELKYLLYWAPSTLTVALSFLNMPLVKSPLVEQYALKILRKFSAEAVVFYLAQLVQCLRHDSRGCLRRYLLHLASKSVMFAHQLIWTVRTEVVKREELTEEELKEIHPAEFAISEILKTMEAEILQVFDDRQMNLYNEEFHFFDSVTEISGRLIPVDKPLRNEKLFEELQSIQVSKHLYLPTSVQYRIMNFQREKCRTLKSAKKVPILIPFEAKTRNTKYDIGSKEDDESEAIDEANNKYSLQKRNLIFKMGDDCRQDQLALQIISMFKRIFDRLHLPLYLCPYRVITTGRGSGIIEAVPNTLSRHEIGTNVGDLFEYFKKKYGHTDSIEYQKARKNFIESMAAYSVVSFILNIKDRHNGNLLVDDVGHVVHIDFGFIFDIAPGGNFSIEISPFKLNREMLFVMEQYNDKSQSESFLLYKDWVIKGYLACRDYIDDFVNITEVMIQSALPCFKKDCIANLKARFSADKSEKEAVEFIQGKINTSYKNLFTVLYDTYQKFFEGVQ